VNHGKLEILELDSIPHSQVSIPNEPDSKAMLEFDPQQIYAITDIEYYNGEVFVSGITKVLRERPGEPEAFSDHEGIPISS